MNEPMLKYKDKKPHIKIKDINNAVKIVEFCNALNDNPHVQSLEIKNCNVNRDALTAIADAKYLKRLRITQCNLNNRTGEILSKNNNFTYLDLSHNALTSADTLSLGEGCKALETLILSHNKIDDASAGAFVKRLENNYLTLYKLDLSHNKLTKKWAEEYKECKAVYWLNLSDNQLGDEGVTILSKNPNMSILELNRNQITDVGAQAIGEHCQAGVVNLDGNMIHNAGLVSIASNVHIISLSVEHNYFGNDALKALSKSKTINTIHISGNDFGRKGLLALAQSDAITTANFRTPLDPTYQRKDARSFRVYAYWKVTQFANIVTNWAGDQLDDKIKKNNDKVQELIEYCKDVHVKEAESFMKTHPMKSSGAAINKAIGSEDENLLHYAVRQNNSALLAVLLEHLPKHELFWKNRNHETYEDLAFSMPDYELPESLSIREVIKRKNNGSTQYNEVETYYNMVKILLAAGRYAALSSIAGVQTAPSFTAQEASAAAGLILPAFIGSIILCIDQMITSNQNFKAAGWLLNESVVDDISEKMKHSQSNSSGNQLITEPEISTKKMIENKFEKTGWEISFLKRLSAAEARAVFHVHKLREHMGNNKAPENTTNDQKSEILLKVINGSSYIYQPPASQLSHIELLYKLDALNQELQASVLKYNLLNEVLDKTKTELDEQIFRNKEQTKMHKSEVDALNMNIHEAIVKYRSLHEKEAERSRTIAQIMSKKIQAISQSVAIRMNRRGHTVLNNETSHQNGNTTTARSTTRWDSANNNAQSENVTVKPGVSINAKI